MQKEDIKAIWDRYSAGLASEEEKSLLESWYLDYENTDRAGLTEEEIADRLAAVSAQLPLSTGTIHLWPGIAAAAAILLVLASAILFYKQYHSNLNGNVSIVNRLDPGPGKNAATLTMPDGKTISLSDTKTGVIVSAEQLIYNDSSKVSAYAVYPNKSSDGAKDKTSYLTASTPRGGEYQITLPDGTKVWLNAETSLQFPQQFNGAVDRVVVLKGEAYFEVVKDKAHPFIVKTERQEVTVLGTHFNINSYADESAIRTTLIEGSVKVSDLRSDRTEVLIPGQQAALSPNGLKVTEVDPEQAVAWKNGIFYFYRADVKTVMRQLARWYNVEVEYQGEIPEHEFTGKIFRKVNASAALNILSELDVKFRIDGRKIIVTP